MSRTTHPLIPAKPTEITLDTLPQLFSHWRGRSCGMTMSTGTTEPPPPADPPARPDGVSEDDWNALGEPGKQAIVRERNARIEAERSLAAARARPTPPPGRPAAPPAPAPGAPSPADKVDSPPPGDQPDLAKIINDAVTAAVKPFQDKEDQREADQAAGKIRAAVVDAAKDRFFDTGDALTGVDMTTLTDGNGSADPAKVKSALDALLTAKPHLGKPSDSRRRGEEGSGSGGTPAEGNIDDRVKASLARMQASVPGVKFADPSST